MPRMLSLYLEVSCDEAWCMQALDERLNAAMGTLAGAEQRLTLAEQSGAQHRQQHDSAQARCVHHPVSSLVSLGAAEKGAQPCRPNGHMQSNVSLQLRLNLHWCEWLCHISKTQSYNTTMCQLAI